MSAAIISWGGSLPPPPPPPRRYVPCDMLWNILMILISKISFNSHPMDLCQWIISFKPSDRDHSRCANGKAGLRTIICLIHNFAQRLMDESKLETWEYPKCDVNITGTQHWGGRAPPQLRLFLQYIIFLTLPNKQKMKTSWICPSTLSIFVRACN